MNLLEIQLENKRNGSNNDEAISGEIILEINKTRYKIKRTGQMNSPTGAFWPMRLYCKILMKMYQKLFH